MMIKWVIRNAKSPENEDKNKIKILNLEPSKTKLQTSQRPQKDRTLKLSWAVMEV